MPESVQNTERSTALVAGCSGAVGGRLVSVLAKSGCWQVIGISRRHALKHPGMEHIQLDLCDRDQCIAALACYPTITHLFYAARASHGEDGIELTGANVSMLENLLDALDSATPGLTHVHLVHGIKYYGQHIGPFRTPARESDPRHLPPNYYYDQQDLVEARSGLKNLI